MEIIGGARLDTNIENIQRTNRPEIEQKNSQMVDTKGVELERENQQDEVGSKEQERRFISLIEQANGKHQNNNNEFQFSVHEQTKQIMIKVVDKQTKEVKKEFPPEKILDMIAKMCEVAGIFVDEKR